MPEMKLKPDRLRAYFIGAPSGVDRQARVLYGMVMALEGAFKTPGRGEFDKDGLKKIVELTNAKPKGLRSNFAHETLSSDGLGKHLGRVRNARMDKAIVERDGRSVEIAAVRGDLHFDPTASNTPSGDLANYVMDLTESDPDALSSSLVIQPKEILRTDARNRPLTDPDGNELPPLWVPLKLFGSDIVSVGDAVDGLLSAGIDVDVLPDAIQRRGAEMLDRFFAGKPREFIEARCQTWLNRYLELRFGALPPPVATPKLDALRKRLEENMLTLNRVRE